MRDAAPTSQFSPSITTDIGTLGAKPDIGLLITTMILLWMTFPISPSTSIRPSNQVYVVCGNRSFSLISGLYCSCAILCAAGVFTPVHVQMSSLHVRNLVKFVLHTLFTGNSTNKEHLPVIGFAVQD